MLSVRAPHFRFAPIVAVPRRSGCSLNLPFIHLVRRTRSNDGHWDLAAGRFRIQPMGKRSLSGEERHFRCTLTLETFRAGGWKRESGRLFRSDLNDQDIVKPGECLLQLLISGKN